jgi:hypothetical protein
MVWLLCGGCDQGKDEQGDGDLGEGSYFTIIDASKAGLEESSLQSVNSPIR